MAAYVQMNDHVLSRSKNETKTATSTHKVDIRQQANLPSILYLPVKKEIYSSDK